MKTYVIDKKNMVIEQRVSLTQKMRDDGYKLVALHGKPDGKDYAEDETVKPENIATVAQIKDAMQVNQFGLKNALLELVK